MGPYVLRLPLVLGPALVLASQESSHHPHQSLAAGVTDEQGLLPLI